MNGRRALAIGLGCLSIAGAMEAAAPLKGVALRSPSTPLETSTVYDAALEALSEGLPSVAVQKLQEFLAGDLTGAEREEATKGLARALSASDRPREALKILDGRGEIKDPALLLLRAQLLSAVGSWEEAFQAFRALHPMMPQTLAPRLGEAEALNALGRVEEAIQLMDALCKDLPLQDPLRLRLASYCLAGRHFKKCTRVLKLVQPSAPADEKWKSYLEGRLLLAQDQPGAALEMFREVGKDRRGLTESLVAGATLGVAESLMSMRGPEAADDFLEESIPKYPDNPYLGSLFEKLDQLYTHEENRSEATLVRWASTQPDACAALAHFYLIKAQLRAGRRDKAANTVTDFVKRFPDHGLCSAALLMQGEVFLEDGRYRAAAASFEAAMRCATGKDAIAQAEIAAGTAYFSEGEFVLAGNLFRSASEGSEKWREIATFNSALAWLNQRNEPQFLRAYRDLSTSYPESDLRRELVLEDGLLKARAGEASAAKSLQLIIKDFPDHRRVPDAQLALAELAFSRPGRDLASTGEYIRATLEASPSGEAADRADYLGILAADAAPDRDDAKIIERCRTFLRNRPESKLIPEVRMKLGQLYFRGEDFANAQTQFETLARDSAGAALAEGALFLAGQCAMKSINPGGLDRALALFLEVAELNGPLKLYARHEQAIAQTQMGMESEAIKLYDIILNSDPSPDLLYSAMAAKGDNLRALASTDARYLRQAVDVFNQLAGLPRVPASWRNQALYKKGKCLQKQDSPTEAMAAFYDVLRGGSGGEGEYFWYYKAGFDAAELLEAQREWKQAIAIYQKMANFEGPRANEAKTRAGNLRLRHFIWDDEGAAR